MTVGAQLQQARNERKLTYAEVTEKTKIQPWVLEAIEANRLPEIMSPIYVKGFIATYAKCLHLDPESLVAQLVWPKAEPTVASAELPPAQPSVPLTFQWPTMQWPVIPAAVLRGLAASVAVTAAVATLVIVKPKMTLPKFSFPKIAKAAPAHAKTAKANTAKLLKIAATPKPAAPAAVPSETPKPSAPVVTEAPAAVVQAASVAPMGAEVLKPAVPPVLTIVPSQAMELQVIATKTTWIKIWADGKLLSQQRLSRGSKEQWTAKKQFQLIIAKPSQVDVTLNGQSISPFMIAHQGRVLITHNGVTRLPDSR